MDQLQEPHIREGIPHADRALKAQGWGFIHESLKHAPLIAEGVFESLSGVTAFFLTQHRTPGSVETQRFQEGLQELEF